MKARTNSLTQPNGHRTIGSSRDVRYRHHRELRILEGTWAPFVDHQPVIDHIAKLRAAGMSVRVIAETSGVPLSTIAALAWPDRHSQARSEGVRALTAQSILELTPQLDLIPDHRHVDATGTKRRLRALQRAGWPLTHVAGLLGVNVQVLDRLARKADKVTAKRAREIRAIYRELTARPGPSEVIRRRAELKGYHGPGAWHAIDDPLEQPDDPGAPPMARPPRSAPTGPRYAPNAAPNPDTTATTATGKPAAHPASTGSTATGTPPKTRRRP